MKSSWKILLAVAALGLLSGALLSRHQRATESPTGFAGQVAAQLPPTAAAPTTEAPAPAARSQAALTSKLFFTPDRRWHEPIPEKPFARFHDWAENYMRTADAPTKDALEAEGIKVAQARRQALANLIRTDPERALELAVPVGVRRWLPASVVSLLEERVSGHGRLAVLAALAEPGKEEEVVPTFRIATIGNTEYQAFVYGRRLGEPSRNHIPLNGITVDDLFAVSENPVRVLEPEEAAEVRARVSAPVCALSGSPSTAIGEEIVAEVGGNAVFFCRPHHAEAFNERLVAAESGPPGESSGDDPEASAWTEGQKALILIRVDFPDLQGVPLSDTSGTNLISNLNNFYTEMSYGRTSFKLAGAGSELTPTFRMPQPAGWYGTNNYYNQLRTDARNAAAAAGYVLSSYNLDVICFGAVPGWSWAGLGYVGAAGAWLRNSFGTGVAGHELGHNYGLNHANYWDTGGQSVIGPGTSVEYGDSFDTMGAASAGNNHFNARYKNYLNWLATNEIVTATSNGVYRIVAHDNPNATGARGLRIVKNSSTNYWVEFRQKFTSNKWLMSGGGLRWAQSGNQKSHLLDTTPGSTDGKTDSAIVIGRTFSDRPAGIHVTPVGKGGTSPESLDVVVNLGAFPSNESPTVTILAALTNAAPGGALNFSAVATDPNGDALAYYWDFGDGNFGTNGPVAGKSWSATGEYVVRCVVSDMKGGVGSDYVIVVIGSPTTYRIGGQVLTTEGAPVEGARMYVSSTRMTYTDSEGTYTLVGLPAGTYTVNASLENYSFASSGFSNPVNVGPNRTGIDFVATFTTATPPTITTQPLSQTVNAGANVTFTVSATGTPPLSYQWRFNGANIGGATATSYTRMNVQPADAGNYSVVVSNVAGTATSANAVLTVNTPPSITAQPQSQTVIAGNTATFTVTATGTAPLAYQWRQNGTNVAGATTSSYTRTNAQPVHAGNYTAVVTNSLGSVTSSPAALTVNYSLTASATAGGTVSKSPDQASYAPGTVVTLTAASVSSFSFSGWSGDAAGTNNPLAVTMTTNLAITANFVSPVADLIVDNPQAAFTGTWTTDTSAADKYGADYRTASSTPGGASATATFAPNVATAGRYDVYVWFPTINKGAASTPFLVSSSEGNLPVNVNQSSGSGGWQVLAAGRLFAQGTNGFVRLSNNIGQGGKNVVADAIRLVYSPYQDSTPPSITMQPTNVTTIAGSTAVFYVAASGTTPLTFQWRRNSGNLAGATNTVLSLSQVQPSDEADYTVVVANSVGSVTSLVATLTVLTPPLITLQPTNQTVIAGDDVTFAVEAAGSPPMDYQWRFNESPIPEATNGLLSLADVQATNAGDYAVVIINAAGVATSSVATLTVLLPPQILSPPESQRVMEDHSATFSVAAAGTAPLSYQWRHNSAAIAGATGPTLLLNNVQTSDAGDYDVTVSNLAGSATSVPATLVVSVRPFIEALRVLTNREVRLVLTGTPGDSYALESSTNLVQWMVLGTAFNSTGTVEFTDPTATNPASCFYRVRLMP